MPNFISEDQIEQALVQKLQHVHGFDVLDCFTENAEDLNDGSKRANKRDVILLDRLREAAIRLNPDIPQTAIDDALERLFDRRQAMTLIAANREIYGLLRDGVAVEFDNAQGLRRQELVRLLDFNNPDNNRYLVVTQLWIKGERGFRRPDVLLYVNGIPLVFVELKNSNVKLRNAFDENLTTYKAEIPQLFLTNVFCVLSNAIETRVGSITAEWEHFFNWLRADDEKEKIDRAAIREQGTSLEGVIEGLLPRRRLLDYVENFVLYYKDSQKIIAQNHQFIGVNRAYDAFLRREELAGKLGVFWHTQGSGKSFSMIFYARKIFRKQTGSFTFVVVTDRDDLDGQIYRNFLNTRTVTEAEAAQPRNSEEMRKFLGQNKRLVFTLIQKFRWDKGREYPELSGRSDIIVIVDEAHRTQYKSLAENMRKGFLQHKLELMLQQNATRTDFAQRLQEIIDAYNSGGSSTENYYEDLIKYTEDLHAEDERHLREGLTEDELELFDLLKKDRMTQEETQKVRLAAKSLLHRLLEERPRVLVQDWYKDGQSKRKVLSAVEEVLHSNLPESYDRVLFKEKCDNVFYLMLDYASHGSKWAA